MQIIFSDEFKRANLNLKKGFFLSPKLVSKMKGSVAEILQKVKWSQKLGLWSDGGNAHILTVWCLKYKHIKRR